MQDCINSTVLIGFDYNLIEAPKPVRLGTWGWLVKTRPDRTQELGQVLLTAPPTAFPFSPLVRSSRFARWLVRKFPSCSR
jgi:hypothetical protein